LAANAPPARVNGLEKAIAAQRFGRIYIPAPMISKRPAPTPGISASKSAIVPLTSVMPYGANVARRTSMMAPVTLPSVST
jgi:hypothetical protein